MGLALSLAFTCYVFAMLYTSVASALLILSITPFLATSMGWFWIGERPKRITWYAMCFAFIGGFFSGIFGFFASAVTGAGLSVFISDFLIILWMGIFGIGIGIVLVTWGATYMPAAEVSVLVLAESVLGPIWPWLLLGEAMTFSEIMGGLLILGSVTTSAFFSTHQT